MKWKWVNSFSELVKKRNEILNINQEVLWLFYLSNLNFNLLGQCFSIFRVVLLICAYE